MEAWLAQEDEQLRDLNPRQTCWATFVLMIRIELVCIECGLHGGSMAGINHLTCVKITVETTHGAHPHRVHTSWYDAWCWLSSQGRGEIESYARDHGCESCFSLKFGPTVITLAALVSSVNGCQGVLVSGGKPRHCTPVVKAAGHVGLQSL